MRFAVIGVGTNSCRLLIARREADRWIAEHHDLRPTRLGQGLAASGKLSPDAVQRTLDAVREFAELGANVDKLFVIGTYALRDASNTPEFIQAARDVAGTEPRVLTGEEEARASFRGALWALTWANGEAAMARETLCVADIGGGSAEIAVREPGAAVVMNSLPVGAVRLTERFFKHDPPEQVELSACRTSVRLALEALDAKARPRGTVAAVGGTADTAARMLNAYDPAAKVKVARVRVEDLRDLLRLTSSLPTSKRKLLHGLPESRADIFPAGLVVVEEIARQAGVREIAITESDLLLGYLIEAVG